MIRKIVWAYGHAGDAPADTLRLGRGDIRHDVRIHNRYGVPPESAEEARLFFLTDREPLIRFILKEMDVLLRVGGLLEITASAHEIHGVGTRSVSQVKHEISIATGGRYRLESVQPAGGTAVRLRYFKSEPVNPAGDDIGSWTFGIITNGQNNDRVRKLVDSILAQKVPRTEILVCGRFDPSPAQNGAGISLIEDVERSGDVRQPIAEKKNRIAKRAAHNNLFMMHDRYLIPDGWYERMKRYGNYWDLLSMPNLGDTGGRVIDWGMYSGRPSEIRGTLRYKLDYDRWSNDWFAQGGLIIMKKHLYERMPLENHLHWSEMEDIQFSQVANLKGAFFYFDPDNFLRTDSKRLGESKNFSASFGEKFGAFLRFAWAYLKNRRLHRKNLRSFRPS